MPKEGNWITLRIFPDGECSLYSWCGTDFDFMGHLTAAPVPPHGRLIDADAFIKSECNNCDGACEAIPCDCLSCTSDCRCDFIKDIDDAPAIIPEEEEE